MNLHEIDWHYASIRRIFEALSEGLEMVEKDLDEAEYANNPYFDVDNALEEADSLLGIAFVTAQTYITSTISDANIVGKPPVKYKKDQLLKNYSDLLPNTQVTKLEMCDAAANYFKHHDEWTGWTATGLNQKTVAILQSVGINEDTEYPCVKALKVLLQTDDYDLKKLLDILSTWRKSVIESVKPR